MSLKKLNQGQKGRPANGLKIAFKNHWFKVAEIDRG